MSARIDTILAIIDAGLGQTAHAVVTTPPYTGTMSTSPSIRSLPKPSADWSGPAADAYDDAFDHYRSLGFDMADAMSLADDAVAEWLR